MSCRSPANFSAAAPTVVGGNCRSPFWKRQGPRLLFSLATGIILCGCHKKSAAPVSPLETQAPATAAAPAAPTAHGPVAQPLPASYQSIAANATADDVAGQLTLELRRYVAYTRSIPKSFEDFTAHDPIKFPPPPAGKKFAISGGAVVLQ